MKKERGFTLIELLIVIAIIAVLAGVVFVALNPLKRFQDARDSRRSADVESILSAIKVQQVDNQGNFLTSIRDATTSPDSLGNPVIYMIGVGTTGCNTDNADCRSDVASSGACVNLAGLSTGGYLGSVPISPAGAVTWDASTTGYTLEKLTNGIITIRACENEGATTPEIQSSK
jgi:prepilin-type N-terminal cleavage/methylation domain-containing protein